MFRNLVHRGRSRWLLGAGLFGGLVAACAADEAALQESMDAQGVVGGSGAVSASGHATAASEVIAGRSAAAASGGRSAAGVAGGGGVSADGRVGTVPAAGSGAAAAAVGGASATAGSGAVTGGSAGAGGDVTAMAGAGAPMVPMAGAAGMPPGAAGTSGAAGSPGSAAAGGAITVWLAGDSTVAKGNTPCPVGWGAEFQALFKPEAKVVNSAVGGRSVRTWLYEVQTQMDSSGECALNKDSSGEPVLQARWQMMLDGMKMGDYLFIQFGINDSSATCDRHVGIEAFKESYGMMAEAAKMRGAQPVFVTPVSAISCSGSMAKPTRGNFVTATTDAGKTYDVPVIDLHERSIALYNQQGLCPIPGGGDVSASTGGKVGSFFCDDHTHFSAEGAAQIAELMAQALKEQKLSLASYLR